MDTVAQDPKGNDTTTATPVKSPEEKVCKQPITRPPVIIQYHIYHNGTIEYQFVDKDGNWLEPTTDRIENRNQVQYFYYDSDNDKPHEITGKCPVNIKRIVNYYQDAAARAKSKEDFGYDYYKDQIGGTHIYLVNVNDIKSYTSSDGTAKFAWQYMKDGRYYANDLTMASLLGAMISTRYTDFYFHGGSLPTGRPGDKSQSHINGMHHDFRYLRNDGHEGQIELNNTDGQGKFALDRQNIFNYALYKFGWIDNLAWHYKDSNGIDIKMGYTRHWDGHHHHIHLQKHVLVPGQKPNEEEQQAKPEVVIVELPVKPSGTGCMPQMLLMLLSILFLFLFVGCASANKNILTLPIDSSQFSGYYSEGTYEVSLLPEYEKLVIKFSNQEASVPRQGIDEYRPKTIKPGLHYYEIGHFLIGDYLYKFVMYQDSTIGGTSSLVLQLNSYNSEGNMLDALIVDDQWSYEGIETFRQFKVDKNLISIDDYVTVIYDLNTYPIYEVENPVPQILSKTQYRIGNGRFILISKEEFKTAPQH